MSCVPAWTRTDAGYRCGCVEITDNGGGFGAAKDGGRWALLLSGRWVANIDLLADAKARGADAISRGCDVDFARLLSGRYIARITRIDGSWRRMSIRRLEIASSSPRGGAYRDAWQTIYNGRVIASHDTLADAKRWIIASEKSGRHD